MTAKSDTAKQKEDHTPAYGYGDVDQECQSGEGIWLQVPSRGGLTVVLQTELPFRYVGHWMRGKYEPCSGANNCDWCTVGIGKKPRYVYAMFNRDRRRSMLFETGPETAGQIREAVVKYGFTTGLTMKLSKAGGRDNGAIIVEPMHGLTRLQDLPQAQDAERTLTKQWSKPTEERG